MNLHHRVCINVIRPDGKKNAVFESGVKTIPRKILTALFGEATNVLALTPGLSVESVEIHEIHDEGGNKNARNAEPYEYCRC